MDDLKIWFIRLENSNTLMSYDVVMQDTLSKVKQTIKDTNAAVVNASGTLLLEKSPIGSWFHADIANTYCAEMPQEYVNKWCYAQCFIESCKGVYAADLHIYDGAEEHTYELMGFMTFVKGSENGL